MIRYFSLILVVSLLLPELRAQGTDKQAQQFAALFEGIYSSKVFSDTTSDKLLREQEALIMPVAAGASGQWFYYGWFAPQMRERPLEEVFIRLFRENDSLLFFFYTIPPEYRGRRDWTQKKPFAEVDFERLAAEQEDNGRCLVRAGETARSFEVVSYKAIEQKFANAGRYKYVEYRARISAEGMVSGSRFLTEAGAVVLDHRGIFRFDRIGKNYKKY